MTEAPADDLVEWLQNYYQRHCDGDWEHSYGFQIENVDNPGWLINFDLADTKMSKIEFEGIHDLRTDTDWIICRKDGDVFFGSGGVFNLKEILRIFRQWVESNIDQNTSVWLED